MLSLQISYFRKRSFVLRLQLRYNFRLLLHRLLQIFILSLNSLHFFLSLLLLLLHLLLLHLQFLLLEHNLSIRLLLLFLLLLLPFSMHKFLFHLFQKLLHLLFLLSFKLDRLIFLTQLFEHLFFNFVKLRNIDDSFTKVYRCGVCTRDHMLELVLMSHSFWKLSD